MKKMDYVVLGCFWCYCLYYLIIYPKFIYPRYHKDKPADAGKLKAKPADAKDKDAGAGKSEAKSEPKSETAKKDE